MKREAHLTVAIFTCTNVNQYSLNHWKLNQATWSWFWKGAASEVRRHTSLAIRRLSTSLYVFLMSAALVTEELAMWRPKETLSSATRGKISILGSSPKITHLGFTEKEINPQKHKHLLLHGKVITEECLYTVICCYIACCMLYLNLCFPTHRKLENLTSLAPL